MKRLCDDGFTVLLETSGALDISSVDPRVRRIMDLKCPSSGEVARNRWENIPHLKREDEVKFVIGTVEDYEWAKTKIAEHKLCVSKKYLTGFSRHENFLLAKKRRRHQFGTDDASGINPHRVSATGECDETCIAKL